MRSVRTWGPGLLLVSPSILLVGFFVYALIGWTANISTTNQNSRFERAAGTSPDAHIGLANYTALFASPDFIASLKHLGILAVVYIVGALFFGMLWALLLEKGVRAEGLFRAVYLFPMAVSMFASGVVWNWLLNSDTGAGASGLNQLFEMAGLGFLKNHWWVSSPTWGIASIAIPAVWQLSGYIMALFLAGFRGIPADLREAARIDGASELQLYRHVLFPQLSPIALSALIILGHMSLKMFDIIMAISGEKNVYTSVPMVTMWTLTGQQDFARAAAVAIILLVLVGLLVVPYLVHTSRQEKNS
ncbi:MAG: carbohydrate ABC transporter permease [Dermatophilaceae bacterium]